MKKSGKQTAAGIPLKAGEVLKALKPFVPDAGLLGCMAGLRQRPLLDGYDLFAEFKGALTGHIGLGTCREAAWEKVRKP